MKPNKIIKIQDALDLEWSKAQANRRFAVSGLMVFIVLVTVTSFIAFGTKSTPNPSPNLTPSRLAPATVVITDQGFVPATVAIKPGQAVVWTNASHSPHFLASDDPKPLTPTEPILNSQQNLAVNDVFSYVYDRAGSYGYHDKDSSLHGTIIVN